MLADLGDVNDEQELEVRIGGGWGEWPRGRGGGGEKRTDPFRTAWVGCKEKAPETELEGGEHGQHGHAPFWGSLAGYMKGKPCLKLTLVHVTEFTQNSSISLVQSVSTFRLFDLLVLFCIV